MRRILIIIVLIAVSSISFSLETAPTLDTPMGSIKALVHYMTIYNGKKDLPTAELKKHAAIKTQLSLILDIKKMGISAMKTQWPKLTEGQKSNFINLFVPLVEEMAFPSNNDYFKQVKITYKPNTKINETTIRVNTTMYDPSDDMTVQTDFILYKSGKIWRVFNILLDNSSLVKDYKNQFNKIINKWNFQKLISLMEKKLKQIRKKK
ncbi:MAG: ABC transporter substrate-binding protein [Elusimicrobiales bacterium]|nr:ABC transporter substrate-binding protein [Spirochaetota bacterium]MCK5584244.1 ABC transporter substrate-binding protein [Elusimicrobiales bacterium]